jgi:hypothetical protein
MSQEISHVAAPVSLELTILFFLSLETEKTVVKSFFAPSPYIQGL